MASKSILGFDVPSFLQNLDTSTSQICTGPPTTGVSTWKVRRTWQVGLVILVINLLTKSVWP